MEIRPNPSILILHFAFGILHSAEMHRSVAVLFGRSTDAIPILFPRIPRECVREAGDVSLGDAIG